ncbi:hypothetical protein RvY_13560 [Ramazzottius varieornatus]|uniref:Uncharacterized protein n=1 Tax=Ramazzottius varieornatus TaxID=947166 RepID=A0A1D1VTI6_RAMVA|nr:hypothetical protein RvY_13560 [Ramazzottius varieornatus]
MDMLPESEAGKRFVQLLTIVRSCVDYPTGKILLCKWLTGDFMQRYTGLWGEFRAEHDGNDLRHAVIRLATSSEAEYLSGADWAADQLNLMAVFQFDVPVPNTEYIFVHEMPANSELTGSAPRVAHINNDGVGKTRGANGYVGSPDLWMCEWFDLDKIPFDQMPVDDALWYDRVIHGQRLTGKFIFAGEPKYALKQHEIHEVDSLESPQVTALSIPNATANAGMLRAVSIDD